MTSGHTCDHTCGQKTQNRMICRSMGVLCGRIRRAELRVLECIDERAHAKFKRVS